MLCTEERVEWGDELRVSGEVVELLDVERWERVGEKAVRRLRRGVKDWKRLGRDGDDILLCCVVWVDVVCLFVVGWWVRR